MSEIEKMQRYIDRTKFNSHDYSMRCREVDALFALSNVALYDTIVMAFNYGKAKGYRAAKAQVRHE